jgi:hypothetical protein
MFVNCPAIFFEAKSMPGFLQVSVRTSCRWCSLSGPLMPRDHQLSRHRVLTGQCPKHMFSPVRTNDSQQICFHQALACNKWTLSRPQPGRPGLSPSSGVPAKGLASTTAHTNTKLALTQLFLSTLPDDTRPNEEMEIQLATFPSATSTRNKHHDHQVHMSL